MTSPDTEGSIRSHFSYSLVMLISSVVVGVWDCRGDSLSKSAQLKRTQFTVIFRDLTKHRSFCMY